MKKEINPIFRDKKHEQLFNDFCSQMRYLDSYHYSAAYLLALDEVVREHVQDVFDFEECAIVPEGLNCEWQTYTSLCTTRLLFNLWNSFCYEMDEEGNVLDTPSRFYAVDEIFSCEHAFYFCEAVQLRFPGCF